MSQACDISRVGKHVVLKHNGLCAGLSWAAAVELFQIVKRLSAFSAAYAQHKDHAQVRNDFETVRPGLTIHRTGLQFTFELQGQIWFACPWSAARQIAKAALVKAREIEEIEKAEQVITDEAILLRTGLPVGLSYNPAINREAWKAAEDVKFPGAVIPQAIFYPPTIVQHPPVAASPEK